MAGCARQTGRARLAHEAATSERPGTTPRRASDWATVRTLTPAAGGRLPLRPALVPDPADEQLGLIDVGLRIK